MSTANNIFSKRTNLKSEGAEERARRAQDVMRDLQVDFDDALHIIALLQQKAAEHPNQERSSFYKLAHVFINMVGGTSISARSGLIEAGLLTIEGACLRLEALQNEYAEDLATLDTNREPAQILRSMQDTLDRHVQALRYK